MGYFPLKPLFPLGRLLLSPGSVALGIDLMRLIRRHQTGDWGDLCAEDRAANQEALASDEAILSLYEITLPAGGTGSIGVMSEQGREFTLVYVTGELLDEEQCN